MPTNPKCKYEHPANDNYQCKNKPTYVISVAIDDTYAHSGYCAEHIDEAREFTYIGSPVYSITEWKAIWEDAELMK